MRTTTWISGATIGALLLGGAAWTGAQQTAGSEGGVEPKLVQVIELRKANWGEEQNEGFATMGQREGLTLTFDLNLPRGWKVAAIEQPERVVAEDSTGTDLSEIEEGFGGRTYVDLAHSWGDEPTRQFIFNLGVASRSAETLSLRAEIPASVYRSTIEVGVDTGEQWAPVNQDVFERDGVTAQRTVQDGQTNVAFRPGTIRDAIESIVLVDGGDRIESNSSMWNDGQVTYFFDGEAGANARVRATVRRGSRTIPLLINLKDVKLP